MKISSQPTIFTHIYNSNFYMTKKEILLKEQHFVYQKKIDKWVNQKDNNIQVSGLFVRNLNIVALKAYVENLFVVKKEEIKNGQN